MLNKIVFVSQSFCSCAIIFSAVWCYIQLRYVVVWCIIVAVVSWYLAMPLTEEVDGDTEYSVVKVDAGCTPKLSHRKSVASDSGRSVVEIIARRSPGSCHMSSSSSWLCAIKKSTKHAVEYRKKGCCSPLQLRVNKVVESTGCLFADDTSMLTCDSNNEATDVCVDNKRTSSPQHLKVC